MVSQIIAKKNEKKIQKKLRVWGVWKQTLSSGEQEYLVEKWRHLGTMTDKNKWEEQVSNMVKWEGKYSAVLQENRGTV